jgi:hypothetical protein
MLYGLGLKSWRTSCQAPCEQDIVLWAILLVVDEPEGVLRNLESQLRRKQAACTLPSPDGVPYDSIGCLDGLTRSGLSGSGKFYASTLRHQFLVSRKISL